MSKFYGQTDFMAKMTTPCFKGKKWVILAREITYARQSGSFKNFLGLFVRVTWGKESFNCWPGKYLTPSEARIDPWTTIESIKNIEFYFLLPLKVTVCSWFFQPKPKSRWNFSFLYCRYILVIDFNQLIDWYLKKISISMVIDIWFFWIN